MIRQRLLARLIAVAITAGAFCAGMVHAQTGAAPDASSSRAASAATSGKASSGSTGTGTAMSKSDQKMMANLAQANLAEIKTGEMALSKSQNPEVKTFAQKMIDDHTSAQKDLQKLAQDKGVQLPSDMDTRHKAMSAALDKLSADRFDKTYISQGGVSDHKKAHKLVQDIQTKAKDSDLKALGAKLKPVIDSHMDMAKNMKMGKADQKSSGSSGSGKSSSGK